MSERRRPFIRSPHPAGLVVTGRDELMILNDFEYRWLARRQFQQLLEMPCVTSLNDRLRRLYDLRYLERLRVGTVAMGLQPVYLPGEAAIPLIAAHTDRSEGEIRRLLREDARASAVLLPHDLQVNDVRIALSLAMRRHHDLQLERWLNARDAYDAYAPGRMLRPDGYFAFWARGLYHSCFIELDRGTSTLARWMIKVERYREYREQSYFSKRYRGLSRFRVLVTAPSPGRMAQLREATRSVTDRAWWFAVTGEVLGMTDAEQPLWMSVGQEEKRSLIG